MKFPGVCAVADIIKEVFGYCQIEDDLETVKVSPPANQINSIKKGFKGKRSERR